MTATLRQPSVWLIALVALALGLVGCRGSLDVEVARTPLPTVTPTATPRPTPTPPPFRMDCAEIEASKLFTHPAEQDWFIANCLRGPEVRFSYDERLGIGQRVMEIFSVDTAICETGLVSFTVLHEPDLEIFSYLFRNFCSPLDPITLEFPPPPFSCPDSEVIEAVEVSLAWVINFIRIETEVICSPSQEPQGDDSTRSEASQPERS